MTIIAIFSALSGVLYLFGIAIPVAFAPWLELNFSDIPVLIATFALGPLSGSITVVIKVLIKLLFVGTHTNFVGETADLIIGLALVLPTGLIYKKKRTFKGAILSLVSGSLSSTIVAMIANRFILIPFYITVGGMSMEMLTGAMKGLFPDITQESFYVLYIFVSVLPFNLMRCLIASVVTILVYKRISSVIKKMNEKFDPVVEAESQEGKTIAFKRNIITVCIFVGVVLLIIVGIMLRFLLS